MNKICTTIEQSKKLTELGIDVNTADMTHNIFGEPYVRYDTSIDEYHTPAWSLSALLGLMPKFTLNGFGNGQFNCRDERADCYVLLDTYPLDAAFEMVVWLLENKKI